MLNFSGSVRQISVTIEIPSPTPTYFLITYHPTASSEKEFAAADRGYTFASHQAEVGAGYFDDVTNVIQGGQSSVTAMEGSTEESQFATA